MTVINLGIPGENVTPSNQDTSNFQHEVITKNPCNGSYSMMAKPLTALELHYPMIHFLIMLNTCCKPIFCSKGSALQKRQDLFEVTKAC